MAGAGGISAIFRAFADNVAEAAGKIGNSIGRFFDDTADRADASVTTTMGAEDANVQAARGIRPQDPDLPQGSDPAGGPASSNPGADRVARMMRGEKVPKYEATKSLDSRFVGEHVPGNTLWNGKVVTYLSGEGRAALKLTVRDGKLYDADGEPFDTSVGHTLHSDTAPRAIFVMDHDGNIYASNDHLWGEFHHSSFLAGGDVAGAGELQVSNGELQFFSDQSGHYAPSWEMTQQVMTELRSHGVPIDQIPHFFLAPGAPRN